ncbi:hypothetical protein C789_2287 [Microcystis aeruginosa FACHB-905 = DIANCHI905]|uniref:Uncharacterized protein n=1 Tax=Microcystis aeruginosa PCC 7806SL TaxID=1903187 RepID=A0AB33BUQ8_MICA7|nr:hypothetical protein BH695_2318 [Microcystis aeruginosa PCC 7806SL]ELS47885.1 hypothetical protein C789_2287 [Microcystis aeruginosa FACHB-905 = DIANCHI905]
MNWGVEKLSHHPITLSPQNPITPKPYLLPFAYCLLPPDICDKLKKQGYNLSTIEDFLLTIFGIFICNSSIF